MGIPSGIDETISKKQKKKAFAILIAAYKLVELYKTKDIFLKEKYTDLLELTEINCAFSDEDISFYGIGIVPEAFAGLSAVTQQKKIVDGISLLIDIGGGTTDVAFFTLTENHLPNIHSVISFPKGLNFVFEKYILQNKELSISDVQDIFFAEKAKKSLFREEINEYQNHLRKEVGNMVKSIESSFTLSKSIHGRHISEIREQAQKLKDQTAELLKEVKMMRKIILVQTKGIIKF
jgi:actin-like ATPase involved in cell morphogenesis